MSVHPLITGKIKYKKIHLFSLLKPGTWGCYFLQRASDISLIHIDWIWAVFYLYCIFNIEIFFKHREFCLFQNCNACPLLSDIKWVFRKQILISEKLYAREKHVFTFIQAFMSILWILACLCFNSLPPPFLVFFSGHSTVHLVHIVMEHSFIHYIRFIFIQTYTV